MTFSIAALGPDGACGIAVASRAPAVGAAVPFVNLAGAIATQSRFNFVLGAEGVESLQRGAAISDALTALLAADPAPELRQVHGVDRAGRTFAHTGDSVKPWKGSLSREGVSIAGNTLVGPEVLAAMDEAFHAEHDDDELSARLLRALRAGEAAGGDSRGRQSAALLIASAEAAFHHNLRVDDHDDPVVELIRIHDLARRLGHDRAARPRHVPLRLKW